MSIDTIYTCDRCKEEILANRYRIIEYKQPAIDLCSYCYQKFKQFMKGK